MIIDFADTDLQELIEYGKNNKYKRNRPLYGNRSWSDHKS